MSLGVGVKEGMHLDNNALTVLPYITFGATKKRTHINKLGIPTVNVWLTPPQGLLYLSDH